MCEEALDELWVPTDSSELVLDAEVKLINGTRHAVLHPYLGIAMTGLLRIGFGTVGPAGTRARSLRRSQ